MSLLPTDHEEFRTKQYWDDFFKKRGEEAFEWYGTYAELSSLLQKYVSKPNKILNVGCGNSTFSADFYDQGFRNISNLDFSDYVIAEMKTKYSNREQMTWETGDMTDMVLYNESTFDVVFDKGGLDALMSVNTEEVLAKATKFFEEVSRVLVAGGKYITVTLAEKFIINKLASYFDSGRGGWALSFHPVHSSKPSPFIPFFVVLQKSSTSSAPNAPVARYFVDHVGNARPAAELEPSRAVLEKIGQLQDFHRMKFQIAKLEVGRFETVQFWSADSAEVPRFTIFVMDILPHATLSCAVFMVPFGRESEFQFSTQEGLTDIAYKANCKRFLAVCCNRPHAFPPMQELQAELSPIALSLRLADMDPSRESIPFMSVDAESDWETIAQGSSPLSGSYIVEESPDDDLPAAILRRLIFLQNQNFIQTEVRLVARKAPSAGAKSGGKKKAGSGKSGGAAASSGSGGREYDFDFTSLDHHHRAALVSLTLHPDLLSGASSSQAPAAHSALVVGLGGGALPMALQRYLPGLSLWACDLDPVMEAVAREHFGFKCNARSATLVHEGMDLIERLRSRSFDPSVDLKGLQGVTALDLLFIDADSKDPSLGMSAPPAAFVTIESLTSMYEVLKPGGVLLLNVVARAKHLLTALLDRVAYVFQVNAAPAEGVRPSRLYTVKGSSETINMGVVVVKGGLPANAPGKGGKGFNRSLSPAKLEEIEREKALEKWLKDVGLTSDPLMLEALLGEVKPVPRTSEGL